MLHSEGAGSVSNKNDEQPIGNVIRGTNVSQPGYSDPPLLEDTAFMAAADLGHRRHKQQQ